MGIFGALTTSVAGMRAQSFALENISGNIANSQTTAFKRIDTSFLDLIPETRRQPAARRQRDGDVALDQQRAGRRAGGASRDLHGDQRRRLLLGAEARRLQRQLAGVRRRRPLYPPRRLPARQAGLPGQRRRLLPDGHSGRSDHGQPGRLDAGGAAIPERLPARAADHQGGLPRQPRELSADDRARHGRGRLRTAASLELLRRSQSGGARHAGAALHRRDGDRYRSRTTSWRRRPRSRRRRCCPAPAHTNSISTNFVDADTHHGERALPSTSTPAAAIPARRPPARSTSISPRPPSATS